MLRPNEATEISGIRNILYSSQIDSKIDELMLLNLVMAKLIMSILIININFSVLVKLMKNLLPT